MKIIRIIFVSIFVFAFVAAVCGQSARRAENFTATTLDGKTVSLTSLRGKVVLLTFWSTRCAICESEIPKLNRLAGRYTNNEVVFLAASTETEDIIGSYLRDHPFRFKILPDSFGLMLKYAKPDREGRANIAYPAYYVIDQSGRIQYEDRGWDKTEPLAVEISKALASQ